MYLQQAALPLGKLTKDQIGYHNRITIPLSFEETLIQVCLSKRRYLPAFHGLSLPFHVFWLSVDAARAGQRQILLTKNGFVP